jgi:hypothetical protein
VRVRKRERERERKRETADFLIIMCVFAEVIPWVVY